MTSNERWRPRTAAGWRWAALAMVAAAAMLVTGAAGAAGAPTLGVDQLRQGAGHPRADLVRTGGDSTFADRALRPDGPRGQTLFPGDPADDSGGAPDLLSTDISFLDGNVGTAADDEIAWSHFFLNPKGAAAFFDGDFIAFYLNTDNNPGTGLAVTSPALGADYVVIFSGDTFVFVELYRFDGSGLAFVRDLTNIDEYIITDSIAGGLSRVQLFLRPEAIGMSRGQTVTTLIRSLYDYRVIPADFEDLAPNAAPFYSESLPPAPERPGLAVSGPAGITTSTATLNGSVDPNRLGTTYYYEYGPTTAYGSRTPDGNAGAGDGGVPATANLAGLAANTTYHYRLVATNAAGQSVTGDQVITTQRLRRSRIEPAGTSAVTCGNGRCILKNLKLRIGIVDPNRGVAVKTAAALRNIRLVVRCARGCRLNRTITLKRGAITVKGVAGSARQFAGAAEGSPGRLVRLNVSVTGGEYRLDLLKLFTDGRGHPYLLRQGKAEIQVILTKPGYAGSAQVIRAQTTTKRLICGVTNGRPVGCKAFT